MEGCLHGCMMLCRRIVGCARRGWKTIEGAPDFGVESSARINFHERAIKMMLSPGTSNLFGTQIVGGRTRRALTGRDTPALAAEESFDPSASSSLSIYRTIATIASLNHTRARLHFSLRFNPATSIHPLTGLILSSHPTSFAKRFRGSNLIAPGIRSHQAVTIVPRPRTPTRTPPFAIPETR
jgi:hypothetical protein